MRSVLATKQAEQQDLVAKYAADASAYTADAEAARAAETAARAMYTVRKGKRKVEITQISTEVR